MASPVETAIDTIAGTEEAEAVKKWIKESELRIVVMGKTGTGKSTLLNTFLGAKLFEEGDSFNPVTEYVKECNYTIKGVKTIVWDCPGLQDGSGKEDKYLDDLKRKTNGDIHLVLYCINMLETRSDLHWGSAIDKITATFGMNIWKHTALVLTFANIYEKRLEDTVNADERQQKFLDRVHEWQEKLQQKLRSIDGMEESTIAAIKVMAAGKDGRIPLCGQKHWLSDLWAELLNKMSEDAKHIVVKLNEDRFREEGEAREEDQDVDVHNQPIILTPNVKEALKTAAVGVGGIAAGGGIGAGIGALIGGVTFGVASLGLATGIGAGVGAAVGGAAGMVASILLLMYRKKRKEKQYEPLNQKGT